MRTSVNTYYTRDLNFAALLVTLGFKLRRDDPIVRVISENGKPTDTFYFLPETESEDFGRLDTRSVFKAWMGDDRQKADFQSKNPEAYQAIEYMGVLCQNRKAILDCIKANVKPMVHHKVNGQDCYLPLDCSAELRAKMKTMIEEQS
jgi:hypothetical protein